MFLLLAVCVPYLFISVSQPEQKFPYGHPVSVPDYVDGRGSDILALETNDILHRNTTLQKNNNTINHVQPPICQTGSMWSNCVWYIF
jgi:hypothetical protein